MMQPTASFKLMLLWHLLAGQRGVSSRNHMGLLERKAAIKRTADMALAAARGSGARWCRALLLADLKKAAPAEAGGRTAPRVGSVQLREEEDHPEEALPRSSQVPWKRPPVPRRVASASILARMRMVKKRAQVLRRLVPGADALDGFSLLEETPDYVVSLRAQVKLMRSLTAAALAHQSGSPSARCPQEMEDS